jgi:hypothetical protein
LGVQVHSAHAPDCVCGQGCSWDGAEGRRCWFTELPARLQLHQPGRARVLGEQRDLVGAATSAIDGFRLDAVKHIEDAWLTRSALAHRRRRSRPSLSSTSTWSARRSRAIKGTIKYYVNPSTMLDGPVRLPAARADPARTVLIRRAPMSDLDGFLNDEHGYYGSGVMSTFIGNHDIPRTIHLAEDSRCGGARGTAARTRRGGTPPG